MAYGEWWTYMHYLLDLQLRRVLDTLDSNGLAQNTIVIFTSDHGDYAGAHGYSTAKWHAAYEEIARVPFIVSSPLVNRTEQLQEVTQTSSHIDLVPTLLGLAGFSSSDVERLRSRISGHGAVPKLVGTDLSPYLANPGWTVPIPGPDGQPRPGVVYVTLDEITEMTKVDPTYPEYASYQQFLADVEIMRTTQEPRLQPGPVAQPNNVYTLATGTWKYSQYRDPNGVEAMQYEMYHLPSDGVEAVNLLDFRTGQVRTDVSVPGYSSGQLELMRDRLAQQLARQEQLML